LKSVCSKSGWFYTSILLWLCVLSLSSSWDALLAQAGEQARPRPGNAALGPVADIPVSTYDLGVIKSRGTTYHHDFLILSVGSEVLEIREVVVG
jgi:hypothetical protein